MNAPRRTRKRRLRIAFIGRVPKDARRLLEETEEVFRAADTTVEFHLGSPPCGGDMRDITYRADEQTETAAIEASRNALDAKELAIRDGKEVSASEPDACQRLLSWLCEKVQLGWRFWSRIIKIGEETRELIERTRDLLDW